MSSTHQNQGLKHMHGGVKEQDIPRGTSRTYYGNTSPSGTCVRCCCCCCGKQPFCEQKTAAGQHVSGQYRSRDAKPAAAVTAGQCGLIGSSAAVTFPSTNSIHCRACTASTDEAHRDGTQLQDRQNGITACCHMLKKQPTVCGCLPCVISRPGVRA